MTAMVQPPSSSVKAAKALRPRDAASLLLVDRSGSEPRILMGRRHASLVFMPGKFVFPGGRADPVDGAIAAAAELNNNDVAKLLAGMGLVHRCVAPVLSAYALFAKLLKRPASV